MCVVATNVEMGFLNYSMNSQCVCKCVKLFDSIANLITFFFSADFALPPLGLQ